MNKKEYKLLFENAFRFLITDYSFKIISTKTDNWGISILAKNLTTGVEIIDEIREAYIQITLYRLIGDEIVENTVSAIKNGESINGFELGWIIKLKNPDAQIKPAYEYGDGSPFHDEKNGKKNYVEFVAGKLKEYAGDILNGDFSSFGALDKMVKERYKERRKNYNKNE